MGIPTNYTNPEGVDIGMNLVEKSYLMDRYPELADNFRFAGLWLWGNNASGQLGDNTTTNKSSPVQTISSGANWKQISNSLDNTGGIKTDGTLWLWGYGLGGELGNNARTSRSSPIQTISGGTNWKQVSVSSSPASIKTDGTLWLWGYNTSGQLGTNNTTIVSSPVQTVSGGTNWKEVSSATNSIAEGLMAAIKTDGTLWMWGLNTSGQLGDNTTTNKSSPVQTVSGGTNWRQISTQSLNVAAIKTDGTLWLWGSNASGQLGDNTLTSKSSPVQTVAGGTNWKQVSTGDSTAAIKTDGSLWVWGLNDWSQLGINIADAPRSSPIQTVSGGTNWKQVSVGISHMTALKTDGTLWLWGRSNLGQIGQNNNNTAQSPVQTISGGTSWKAISTFGNPSSTSIAIRDNSDDYL
jgi:alpha-tubulin suppressor-like RCC1 family protein